MLLKYENKSSQVKPPSKATDLAVKGRHEGSKDGTSSCYKFPKWTTTNTQSLLLSEISSLQNILEPQNQPMCQALSKLGPSFFFLLFKIVFSHIIYPNHSFSSLYSPSSCLPSLSSKFTPFVSIIRKQIGF